MLLGAGRSPRAAVSGPMAEVVYHSLQYLSDADLQAMADYLQALTANGQGRRASADPLHLRRCSVGGPRTSVNACSAMEARARAILRPFLRWQATGR